MIVADRTKQPKGMGVQFEGTEGWIWVERGDSLESSDPGCATSVIAPNEIHLYKSDDHHQNFLDCVRSRQKTITPAESGSPLHHDRPSRPHRHEARHARSSGTPPPNVS